MLNAQDVVNILNSQFVIRNEEVRGSSPLTSAIIVICLGSFRVSVRSLPLDCFFGFLCLSWLWRQRACRWQVLTVFG